MVLLNKAYNGYAAGTIVQLQTATESALVAQGLASVSAGPVTPGAVTTTETAGRIGIAAAATTVVITNPKITTETKVWAQLSNSGADATLTSVRVTPSNGSVLISGNAAATAAVAVDWMILMQSGELATA